MLLYAEKKNRMAEVRARGSAWTEHRPSKPGIAGSSPAGSARSQASDDLADKRHARVLFTRERKDRKSFKEMRSFISY